MGGINLLDQLKAKNSGYSSEHSAAPKSRFSFGGPDSGETVKLLFRVVFLAVVGFVGHLVLEQHKGDESTKLEEELKQLNTSLEQETKKKSQMKDIDEEMRGYLSRVEELQGKLKAVSQQETDRTYLVRALEYVAIEMPKEIWLSEVSTSRGGSAGDKEVPTAIFKGFAISAQSVSDFIQKLENSVYFPSTTLDQMELVAGQELGSSTAGVISIPPNSRKFQIMAKLGE